MGGVCVHELHFNSDPTSSLTQTNKMVDGGCGQDTQAVLLETN